MQSSDSFKQASESNLPAPVIGPGHTYDSVTEKISAIVLSRRTPPAWFIIFGVACLGSAMLFGTITYLLYMGVGIWGNNVPVGWGLDILNFIWWVGIGHAGTLISAILLLFRQQWRTSINRFAEAMTLFAVANAGLYPLLHTGRPWFDYWLMPYPNTFGLWPNFRSPLVWDVFAISTYATVSLLFWYVGLIPDLATLRDRSKNPIARILYGLFAMGWRNSAAHWNRYHAAYLMLAALATPLVVSVHSVVSLDFASGIIPGWQVTMFPPYFVAGAIFSGFAMVLTLSIPLRKFYGLEDFITMRHIDNMAKIMLVTGLIVFYGYTMEIFFGWYSGSLYEEYLVLNRMFGPYALMYWALILCNGMIPQLLWFPAVRKNLAVLFVISIIVNIGMWLERFVIIVTALHRDFLPSAWGMYSPTIFDWTMFIGTIGFFLTLLLLFIRVLPVISIFEMRELVPESEQPK